MAKISEEDDLSFVVLGPGSMPSYLTDTTSMDATNLNGYSLIAGSKDTDVQNKLDQLIKENIELRETLNSTNLTMKTQFETLSQWQQDVRNVHNSHREKFAETRNLVLKLKMENETLKKQLGSRLDFQFADCSSELKNEIIRLSNTIKNLGSDNLILVKERDAFRDECVRLNGKIVFLENCVRQKTEEIHIMRGNFESLAYKSDDISYSPSMNKSALPQFLSKSLMAAEVDNRERAVSHGPKVFKCNAECDKRIRAAADEIEQLSKMLQAEQEDSKHLKILLTNAQETLKTQYDEHCRVVSEFEMKLKESSKSLQQIQQELEIKDGRLKSTTLKLEEAYANNDELATLKAQVSVYENDYKEERKARERLADEKEALATELRTLKARMSRPRPSNAVVLPETADHGSSQIRNKEGTDPGSAVPDANLVGTTDDDDSRPFACPICLLRFVFEEECQRHVNYCLDHWVDTSIELN